MSVFSKRHRRAISEGKLDAQLDPRLRGRIWRLMGNFNESYSYEPEPGSHWTERTDHFDQVCGTLLDISGESVLNVGGTRVDVEEWVKDGPALGVLDAVEFFYLEIDEAQRPSFSTDLNRVLGEEDASWRLLDGQFILLSDVFVHEQIVASSQQALHSVRFEGASQEMLDAQHDLVDKDTRGAVHSAGKSFESAMKAALDREDHMAAKKLIETLLAEGFFDGVPDKLRGGFVGQVMLALPWLRNNLGGHGQGKGTQPLPEPYARLAVGLAAVFNEFIVGLAIERDSSLIKPSEESPSSGPDILIDDGDFVTAPIAGSAADEDIPF